VGSGGSLGLHGGVGNLLEAYQGGGLTRATCQRWGGGIGGRGRTSPSRSGVASVDGRVSEQHTAEVELVGGSDGPRSGQGKLSPAGCLVADRVGTLTGAPEELPHLPDGAPAR
jgi:hypothetical protein